MSFQYKDLLQCFNLSTIILECQLKKSGEFSLTQSRTKKIFLKRPIYKIPCKEEGCNTVIHTRSFNRKKCHKHSINSRYKYKVNKRSQDKIKDMQSPYTIKPQKKRDCLKCGKKFESLSDSNRICVKCNSENDSLKGSMPFHGWHLTMSNDFGAAIRYSGYGIGDMRNKLSEWSY